MDSSQDAEDQLRAVFAEIGPHLDERQRRLLAGAYARALGSQGIATVARAFEMPEAAVSRGADELAAEQLPTRRVWPPGGEVQSAVDADFQD